MRVCRSFVVILCLLSLSGCQTQGYQVNRMVLAQIDDNKNHHLISIGSLKGTIDRSIDVPDAQTVHIHATTASGTVELKLYDIHGNQIYAAGIRVGEELDEVLEHSFAAGAYTVEIESSKARKIRIELYFASDKQE